MNPLNQLSGRVKRSYTVPWIIKKLTLVSVVIPYQALCQRSGSIHQLKLRIFSYQFVKEAAGQEPDFLSHTACVWTWVYQLVAV